MNEEELKKLKERLDAITDPQQITPLERDLSQAFISLNETIKEKGRTDGERWDKFEKQAKELVALKQTVDRLRLIQNAPTPYLPFGANAREAVQAEGFYTRSLRGSLDSVDARVLQLQSVNDRLGLGVLMYRTFRNDFQTPAPEIARSFFPKTWKEWEGLNQTFRAAMDTGESGAGLDWVATLWSPRIKELMRLELKVLAQFKNTEQMPSATYKGPCEGADHEAHLATEQTASTGQTLIEGVSPGTGSKTQYAKYSVSGTWYSEQLEDTSIVNIEQNVLQKHPIAHYTAWDRAVLEGDDNTTHMDSDVTASTAFRKAFKGLRYMALKMTSNSAKVDIANFSDSIMYKIEEKMGKYALLPGCFWQTGIKAYYALKKLMLAQTYIPAEILMMILSKEVQPGVLDYYHGKPVIVSELQRENLNELGVYDASTTTKACIMCVQPGAFTVGHFKALQLRVLREIAALSMQVVVRSHMAQAFTCNVDYATEPVVGIGINLDVS